MSRTLFLALVLPILAAECVAQFALHDQQWTTVCALLGLAVVAIRWACGPRADDQCAVDCPKCAESEGEQR